MCSEVQHMSSTTELQQICPAIIDTGLEPDLIQLSKKAAQTKADFGNLLLEAVDSAFSTISDANSQALYSHLKSNFGITRDAIPNDVEGFATALEAAFGQGALLIEIEIMKSIHSKVAQIQFAPTEGELSFLSYLECIRSGTKSL